MLLRAKTTEEQQHHRSEAFGHGGATADFFKPSEVLFSADDVLLHRFLGSSPHLGAVEGGDEQLVDLHGLDSGNRSLERLQECLQSFVGGIAFGVLGLDLAVLHFSGSPLTAASASVGDPARPGRDLRSERPPKAAGEEQQLPAAPAAARKGRAGSAVRCARQRPVTDGLRLPSKADAWRRGSTAPVLCQKGRPAGVK